MKRIAVVNVISLIVVLVCGVVPASADTPVGVDLAGLDGWNIVVADDAIASEIYAAEEFQKLFQQASGVKLGITHNINRSDRHVFIGPSKMLQCSNVGFSTEDFGDEDLRIVIKAENIAIAGGRPRGTLYGVYTFLEDYLGVRFLTHDHTHVPPVGDWRMVGPVDRFYHPPLDSYRLSAYLETDLHPVFAARIRCNVRFPDISNPVREEARFGGLSAMRLINHSLHRWVPADKYAKTHPEYWALVDGKRRPRNSAGNPLQICATNPDVLKIVTPSVLDWLAEHPEEAMVSVSVGDYGSYCQCPRCAALDRREQSHLGSALPLVNAVADEVARKYPHIKVGTLAYSSWEQAPKTIKPRPNVKVQLCSHDCAQLKPINAPDSKLNAAFRSNLAAWSRICDDINIWYYNTNFVTYLLPVPNLRVIEPDIRFFVANNAKGIFMQGAHNAPGSNLSDLRNYMTSRLLWDPNQSGQQLMDEFLDLHYGKAAPPIRRWLNLIHDTAEAKAIEKPYWGTGKDYGFDEQIIRVGLEVFEEAMKLAEDEVIRARVEKASICAYMAAVEPAVYWSWSNIEGKTGEKMPGKLLKTRPHFGRMLELCKKHGVTHFQENTTIERASAYFKQGYGIKADEPW